jgi:Zn-dependent peptidase ImmA (M78 family)
LTKTDPYALAARHAEDVIRNQKIDVFPVDPTVVATNIGIEVRAKPAGTTGIAGMFLRFGEFYGIVYATHIRSVGFQRFSVAHELGHYFLPGHIDAVLPDNGVHQSHSGFVSQDPYEREADHFAAALLMPRHLFLPAMRKAGTGLAAVEYMRELCGTSLTATAIRYAQCSDDPIAIVMSTGNAIDYCFMSDSLKEMDGIDWIRRSQVLPRGTPTFLFNQNGERVQAGERAEGTSDLQEWFGGSRSIEVSEDVVGLGSYGKTLTVLYDIDLLDEEEESEEASLAESWQPRHRR